MSLKQNVFAGYISHIYVTVIGIVMVPLYLQYMTAEAYGLVGFFAMLQAWFNLLDMGLTPTISRETARFRGGATDALSFRRLVRALEGIFLGLAVLGGGAIFLAADFIANDWLKASLLPIAEVRASIELIAVIIALRWMAGLYRGAISGAELQVWLSGFNTFFATLRFVGVLLVLMYIGGKPSYFFKYQLGVAILEFFVLLLKTYLLLPSIPKAIYLPWSWAPLKSVLKFSLTIAFTSSVWVMVTQLDKLVLSKLLKLTEYGYFTLAVLVANGIMTISSPISTAIMPRMVRLEAEGNHNGLISVYRQSTQLVTVIAGATAVTVAFWSERILWAWTGNPVLAAHASPILILYAIGNALLAVCAFPYYLQYAKGDLKLHLIGNIWFVVFMIPAIIWAANEYGGVGAAYVWLIVNALYFIAWIPIVHNRFAKGLNWDWYLIDVLVIWYNITLAGYGLHSIISPINNRWWQFGLILFMGLLNMIVGVMASSAVRSRIKTWVSVRKF